MSKISIVVPTYNRVGQLAEAIRSVRNQTMDDWQLIIVDDCSTDKTDKMVYGWNDPRINYYRLAENSGSPVLPRNFGVRRAKTRYVAFLDSDDIWLPNKLETQLWYMEYHQSLFTYHDMRVNHKDKDGHIKRVERWSKISTCQSDMVFPFLLRKNFIPTSSVMLQRELYFKYGGMNAYYTISHDWDLWLRIAFDHQIHFVNEKLGELTIHHGGSVISEAHRRRRESREIIRTWMDYVDGMWYRKIMLYYYLMEVFDILPRPLQQGIRKLWYSQRKYK